MKEYITTHGDSADYVAWKHYGSTDNREVEAVLEANHGLADMGAILPAGVKIILPDFTPPPVTKGVKLWD